MITFGKEYGLFKTNIEMLLLSSPAAVRNFPSPQSLWSIADSGLSSDFDDNCPEQEYRVKVTNLTEDLLKVIAEMILLKSENGMDKGEKAKVIYCRLEFFFLVPAKKALTKAITDA